MGMGCIRAISLIDCLSPIRLRRIGVGVFSIGRMIVMIVSGVWLWDVIRLIRPIKGVSA